MILEGTEYVTNSLLSDFQFCPRFYDLRYEQGWSSPAENIPLSFGSAVHAGLKVLYDNISEWDATKACLAFGRGVCPVCR